MIDPISNRLYRNAGEHGPVILMYHSVSPGKNTPAWPWAVSLERFRAQLDLLKDGGWKTPTLHELISDPERYKTRTALITFDDGYVDNLAACEELQRRGQHATWFIVSGSIGISPTWPSDGRPTGRLLAKDDLRQMQSVGMEIGSHTTSHVRLPALDDTALRRELIDSKAALEDVLGRPVSSFAYPYGAWDERCADEVKAADYDAACTTRTGWAMRDRTPYHLRRLTIFNHDNAASFARKLYFGSHDVQWLDILKYAFRRRTKE